MGQLSASEHFDDPDLGRLSRVPATDSWRFALLLPNGRTVPGALECPRPELQSTLLQIRPRLIWLRDNEQAAREYIAGKMHGMWQRRWYDPHFHAPTPRDEFRDRIWLAGLFVIDRLIQLHYNDAAFFGGKTLVLELRNVATFGGAPDLVG